MNTRRELARSVETADQQAWYDMYAAIPPGFGEMLGLERASVGELPLFLCKRIPFIHFNAAGATFGLGGVDAAQIDAVGAAWRERGIGQHWIHTFPELNAELPAALAARGYTESSRWDRVYRPPGPANAAPELPRAIAVQRVQDGQAWAAFIDKVYGLPNSPWLLALVGRPGWHHYVALEQGRIVAVRTLYVQDGWGWLGIDAPIPGVMTQDFAPDRAILRAIVQDLEALGCAHLVSDVEACSPGRDTEAYASYRELGFEVLYTRVNLAGA